ncbi:MAG: 3-hydroxyacyl-CoA dehydrogenase NAD-binding domain-containing protein [Pirellulales bacterium]|nr:3-hydroxyacyl-CoA dehydrogenase NAD-binding domain-containing protein [Pirellulales bacterium]
MADPTLALSMLADDIGAITLDMPGKGANVLSASVLDELEKILDELDGMANLAGVVVRSGKPGMFIAGADVREFVAAIEQGGVDGVNRQWVIDVSTRGQSLFRRLGSSNYVSVAAIDGVALGGGAELAVWCDRRIMSTNPKAAFGLPEVKLGMFPGWGGTARLPRIVGLSNAVEMITGGENVNAASAEQMGLTSDTAASDDLDAAAIRLIRAEQTSGQYLQDRDAWALPISMTETELYFLGATANAYIQQQTKGNYPAPIAALELMLESAAGDVDAACKLEAEAFADIFGTPVNRSLLNVFFLTDRNKKDRGVADRSIEPGKVSSLSVFGAGLMGSAIAAASVKRGINVAISDANSESLQRGVANLLEEASYDRVIGGPNAKKSIELAAKVNATESLAEMCEADIVLEAIVENEDVKKKLYASFEADLPAKKILATNTSTIPLKNLAAGLKHPERFCGIHFFNPVRKMKLVEVIRGPQTSDQTIATAVAYAKSIGKSPVVVNDGPGFLVNRCLLPYMNEALELMQDGASIKAIEKAAKSFGMPMGPITLYDVVGLDTAYFAGMTLVNAFPDRCGVSAIMETMVNAKRLGQKSRVGFFKYTDPRKKGEPDASLDDLLQPVMRDRQDFTPQQIEDRLFLPMLLEATRILEEGIVRDPRDVDLGLIFGIGFPPFLGGLFFWADACGAESIVERLKPYEGLGERMRPTEMLLQLASSGGKFYDA